MPRRKAAVTKRIAKKILAAAVQATKPGKGRSSRRSAPRGVPRADRTGARRSGPEENDGDDQRGEIQSGPSRPLTGSPGRGEPRIDAGSGKSAVEGALVDREADEPTACPWRETGSRNRPRKYPRPRHWKIEHDRDENREEEDPVVGGRGCRSRTAHSVALTPLKSLGMPAPA